MEGNQNQNNVIVKQNENQNNNQIENQNNNQNDNQYNNQNDNQYNNQNDFNSNVLIFNNNFEPKILNNRNIYNINLNINSNANIPNNPINNEGLEESATKKVEYEQSYDLPDEEEIKNNKGDINQSIENNLNKDTETDKGDAPAPVNKN